MLILDRKARQSIEIGDDITVKILRIEDTKYGLHCKVGIDAPNTVRIVRTELLDRDRRGNSADPE